MRGAAAAVLIVAVSAVVGCHRPAPTTSAGAERAAAFARVEEAREAFEEARNRLGSRTGTATDEASRAAFDAAFTRYQSELARFLTTALNLFPDAPETRSGVELYARSAVEIADQALARGGDLSAALQALADARRNFDVVGTSPPAELGAAIERVRSRLGTQRTPLASGTARP
ncbi:MAG: hypothetical protein ACM3O7_00305 [Acidobacteriota bacterium]